MWCTKRSRDWSVLAGVCVLLMLAGGSQGTLELGVSAAKRTTLKETRRLEFTLHCTQDGSSTVKEEVSSSNNMATAPDNGDSESGTGMEMVKEQNSLQFYLNNSIIYPNDTILLHNFSVQRHAADAYTAHFHLNPYDVFLGNFTCRRNYTISNDVLLAYVPLTNLDMTANPSTADSSSSQQLSNAVIGLGISLFITLAVTIVFCVGIGLVVSNARRSCYNRVKATPLHSACHRSASILQFTASGYAVPKCSVDKRKYISATDVAASSVLSKRTIVRVLKYLLHPSDCAKKNCLCREVKQEYYALLDELKPNTADNVYPLCFGSEPALAAVATETCGVELEKLQSRPNRPQSLYAEDISIDHPESSVITIEEGNSTCSSYCKDGCSLTTTMAPSMSNLPHYPSGLSVTSPVLLEMSFVNPIERVTFDSNGGRYINQDHGVGLTVPMGAIPEGERVTIEIGVSLTCPVSFPSETRPVSAIVSMCVVDHPNYTFKKPVEVRLTHCLDIASEKDVNELEVGFIKSGHNLFCFHKAEGESTFEPGTNCGLLTTHHFCCFCISANKKKADLSKINYRLIKVTPADDCTASLRWKTRYCITYFLPTCLQALEKQYCPTKYNIKSLKRFKFANRASSEKPYVGISFERRVAGEWVLALESSDKIYAKDIDFWEYEPFELEQMESEELYPPRFVIDVCGTQACATGQVWVNFSGMADEFKSELILDTSRGLPQCTFNNYPPPPCAHWPTGPHSNRYSFPPFSMAASNFNHHHPPYYSEPCLCDRCKPPQPKPVLDTSQGSSQESALDVSPSDESLMNMVAAAIPLKWRLFGIQVGLEQAHLEIIEQRHAFSPNSHVSCFGEVFLEWKRRMTKPFTWSTVITALKSQLIGENTLAHKLQTELEARVTDDIDSQHSLE